SHTKWIELQEGRIADLATYMSGEILALLKRDSLVSRLIPAESTPRPDAFRRGVEMALDGKAVPGAVLRRIFSARSLVLFHELKPEEISDYLTGLLIGGEIREATEQHPADIAIIGEDDLSLKYRTALGLAGISAKIISQTPALGFMEVARTVAAGKM